MGTQLVSSSWTTQLLFSSPLQKWDIIPLPEGVPPKGRNMDAKNLLESLKVEITCFMCFGYFTDPVIVKCGHTFCKECLLSCWKEDHKPIICPNCKAIIKFGDFLYNRRLQDLAIIGKMLRPHFLQSIRDLTICEKHGKEETLFCEEDYRPLCGPCFLTTEHKEHKVLSLEKAAGQCMEKLQATWNILKSKKEKFQMELEWGKMRVAQWEVEGQSLKDLVVSEYEKMHQFFVEEEQLRLQSLGEETRHHVAAEESKASQAQDTLNLPADSEKRPVRMLQLEGQAMKQSVKSEFEKKHQFLSEQEQLHLQRLDQEIKDNLAKFEESKAKMTQQIHNLQMAMSEIEKNFEKLPIEMLQDAKGTLERNEELLLQNPLVASPRWTKYPIPGMTEMLLTFYREITLDPATANPHLILSDDLKSVKCVSVPQDVPDNPERFDVSLCVLATQRFTSGKHYWEVEVGNKSEWEVGICKESIRRKGNVFNLSKDRHTLVALEFGNDFLLWCSYFVIPIGQPIHKMGIFLDYEKGHIAFYNATDGTVIHSPPDDAFQGPLCPFFSPSFRNVKIAPGPLCICPRSN
ncbi:probable E3 ubiquitin-protein ligase TRIML1 [Vombatus ursinus]|uniref:probable E3 ubiquitin-protein ligase TRIML1 n=1 Tax=Vombatus ursinus TaxID=29139 RepID=UPI000FFD3FCC|nr:probable E3 ubiquitin-protein ligase TRIML1 [Vombatus ursinus]